MYKLENDVAWTTDLKNAFKHGVTRGKIKYYDDNNEPVIIDESNGIKSIKLYDEKNVPKQGFIGQATSKQVDLELLNIIDTHNLENKEIEVFLGADYNNQTYYINYGNFIVNQAPENDVTNGIIKITAFDYMIKTNIPYIPTVTFPCTLKDVVDDICTQTGLILATQDFANKNFIVDSNQFDGKTCKEVLRHVGKCAFSWVRIGQDNELYIDFEVNNTITESLTTDDYYQDKLKKANEYYGPINRVVYAESNIQGQEEKVEDVESIALNGLHELVIYDNYFAYTTEKRHELIQAGTRLFGLKYMPVQEMAMVGLVYLDCTDIIEAATPDEETFTTIPLNHIIEYNGAIGDSLSTETNSNNETVYKNTNDPINSNAIVEIMVDRFKKIITSIISDVTEQNSKISQITQTVDELDSKIQDIADITTAGETSYASLDLDGINESEPISITVRPIATNISYLYPRASGLYPDDTLFMPDRKLRFINRTTDEIFDYILPDDLLYYDSENYDEFYLNYDSQTCQVIKRCAYDADGNVVLLANEAITSYTPYPSIYLTAGDYTVELLGYSIGYLAVRLMASNIYTSQFATKSEVTSEINQKANEINLVVNQKVDNRNFTHAEIVAKINDDTSQVKLQADKINLTANDIINIIAGNVLNLTSKSIAINSTNFSVTSAGVLTAKSGTIGGFNITESSIYKNKNSLNSNTNGVYIGTDGISLGSGSKFKVTPDGKIIVSDIEITGGTINMIAENVGGVDVFTLRAPSHNAKVSYSGRNLQFYKGGNIPQIDMGVFSDIDQAYLDLNGEIMCTGKMYCEQVIQTSLESKKKKIKRYNEKAIEIVKNSDIYEYQYNEENETGKKHLGFVIGDLGGKYRTPNIVISPKGNGIESYTMISILWKAVQEQQEQIEELKKEINKMKGEK